MQIQTLNAPNLNLPHLCKKIALRSLRMGVGLIIGLAGNPIMAQSLNPNQDAIFNALESTCPPPQISESPNSSNPICDINFTSLADLQSLIPDQVIAIGSQAIRVNGGKTTQPSGYFRLYEKKSSGGGAGDIDYPPLNFWGKVESNFGSQDTTSTQAGYNFDFHNFVVGADYRLQDNWVIGSSFLYRHNNASFDGNRGETLIDSYTGMLYTSYNITEALHVEATASYGGSAYENSRNIALSTGTTIAKGSPDAGQYAFSWGGGYDFIYQALTIAPYARGEYINLDIDSYSEAGSIAAMQFDKQTIESMTSTVGIQTAYTFSFPWGVLIPQLRGEWHHQYLDGQRQIRTSFIADPSVNFILTSEGPSRDYYTFGSEVSTVLPGGISAFLAYETLQGYANINSNKLMLGGRIEF